ncbi:MAG: hypothetical protein JNM66_05720 [Bryobacterales bacterium]|nr:hypothetical protein [Bryobacterales bacterium]
MVLGGAFVALVCDYLKGNNEQLREHNIELRVRKEEQERRLLLDPAGFLGQFVPGANTVARSATSAESGANGGGRTVAPHEVMQSFAMPEALSKAEARAAKMQSRGEDDSYEAADVPPLTQRRSSRKRPVRGADKPSKSNGDKYADWVRPEVIARVARKAEASAAHASDVREDLGITPEPMEAAPASSPAISDTRLLLPESQSSREMRADLTPAAVTPPSAWVSPVAGDFRGPIPEPATVVAESRMKPEEAERLQKEIERVAQLERQPLAPAPGTILRPLTVPSLRLEEEIQRIAEQPKASVPPIQSEWHSQLLDDVIAASASREPAALPTAKLKSEVAASPVNPTARIGTTFRAEMMAEPVPVQAKAFDVERKMPAVEPNGSELAVPLMAVVPGLDEIELEAPAAPEVVSPASVILTPPESVPAWTELGVSVASGDEDVAEPPVVVAAALDEIELEASGTPEVAAPVGVMFDSPEVVPTWPEFGVSVDSGDEDMAEPPVVVATALDEIELEASGTPEVAAPVGVMFDAPEVVPAWTELGVSVASGDEDMAGPPVVVAAASDEIELEASGTPEVVAPVGVLFDAPVAAPEWPEFGVSVDSGDEEVALPRASEIGIEAPPALDFARSSEVAAWSTADETVSPTVEMNAAPPPMVAAEEGDVELEAIEELLAATPSVTGHEFGSPIADPPREREESLPLLAQEEQVPAETHPYALYFDIESKPFGEMEVPALADPVPVNYVGTLATPNPLAADPIQAELPSLSFVLNSEPEASREPETPFPSECEFSPYLVSPRSSHLAGMGVSPVVHYLPVMPPIDRPRVQFAVAEEPSLSRAIPARADDEERDSLPDLLPVHSDMSWEPLPALAEAPLPVFADSFAEPVGLMPIESEPPPVWNAPAVAAEVTVPPSAAAPIDITALRQPEPEAVAPAAAIPDLLLPTGIHDVGTWMRLLSLPNPMTGILFVITLQSSDGVSVVERKNPLPASDNAAAIDKLMASFVREGDFGARILENEWVFVYSHDVAGFNQRRVGMISEKLWDFQLRHLGMANVSFKWGAVDVKSEPLGEAVQAARDRMNQTRRTRKLPGADSSVPRRVVNA